LRIRAGLLLYGAASGIAATPAGADIRILTVGLSGDYQYRTISAAVDAADADTNAGNYYDVQVAPGTYTNDFPVVTRRMTIEVDPKRAGNAVLLKATVPLPNQKGIVLTFASLTVDGLTFSGATIDNSLGGNGAGIRDQNTVGGATLVVRNSVFTDNQEGILTGEDAGETITVTNSKFENNGNPDPRYFQHALYVNRAGRLTVSDSLFCGQLIGHAIKSRALVTRIENNQIYDGQGYPPVGCRAGSSSFAIDTPEGGVTTIAGNRIFQGPATQNNKMVAYGEEGLPFGNNSLIVSNNVFTNSAPHATGIYDPKCIPIQLTNNTFQGVATPVDPSGCAVNK
jgi:parallel beta helix pectate lyase-like protein